MLKNVPKNISPLLLKTICEMGHGDEIVLADGNFPAASHTSLLIDCSSSDIPSILESILKLFPLDQYVANPIGLMDPGSNAIPEIWGRYEDIVVRETEYSSKDFERIERFDFYKRAKSAYAIVSTCEEALYANIILKKGVVTTS